MDNYINFFNSLKRKRAQQSQQERKTFSLAQFFEKDLELKDNERTFLKKYSFQQSSIFYELKIVHLDMRKEQRNDEMTTKEEEFESLHQIPIFRTPQDESWKKSTIFGQINYNSKYYWVFLNELDNCPYFQIKDKDNSYLKPNNVILEGYYRLFRSRHTLMRCHDRKSQKNYILKCIQIEDDQEYLETLREIAINIYINHNLSKTQVPNKSNTKETDKEEDHNLKEEQKQNEQFEGGILNYVDSYVVHRTGQEQCFILVFEDAQFSLKDLILKNTLDLEDNPDKDEIKKEELYSLISIMAKQIQKLKRIGIFHNNITPQNIFFQNSKTGKKRILLSNFFISLIMKPSQFQGPFSAVFSKLSSDFYKYRAPEVRRNMEMCVQDKDTVFFDPVKAEIYSLGVCCLELQIGRIFDDSELVEIIERINQDTFDGDLLLSMIHFGESDRYSEEQVLEYLQEGESQDKQLVSFTSQNSQSGLFSHHKRTISLKTMKNGKVFFFKQAYQSGDQFHFILNNHVNFINPIH